MPLAQPCCSSITRTVPLPHPKNTSDSDLSILPARSSLERGIFYIPQCAVNWCKDKIFSASFLPCFFLVQPSVVMIHHLSQTIRRLKYWKNFSFDLAICPSDFLHLLISILYLTWADVLFCLHWGWISILISSSSFPLKHTVFNTRFIFFFPFGGIEWVPGFQHGILSSFYTTSRNFNFLAFPCRLILTSLWFWGRTKIPLSGT